MSSMLRREFRLTRRLFSSSGKERGRLTLMTPEILREKEDEAMTTLYVVDISSRFTFACFNDVAKM